MNIKFFTILLSPNLFQLLQKIKPLFDSQIISKSKQRNLKSLNSKYNQIPKQLQIFYPSKI